jgi:hypothetical protein
MRFRAQHASCPYTFWGVKILTILGQLQLEKKFEAFSIKNNEIVTVSLQVAFASVLV